jgi:hypothetical protein
VLPCKPLPPVTTAAQPPVTTTAQFTFNPQAHTVTTNINKHTPTRTSKHPHRPLSVFTFVAFFTLLFLFFNNFLECARPSGEWCGFSRCTAAHCDCPPMSPGELSRSCRFAAPFLRSSVSRIVPHHHVSASRCLPRALLSQAYVQKTFKT